MCEVTYCSLPAKLHAIICSPYLSSNLPKLVDLSSLLLQLSEILFLSLSVLLHPVHRFILLLRLTFSPLRSISSSIGILNFDPAPCMTLLWVMVWASCVAGVVGLFLCTQDVPDIVPGR